MQTGNQTGRYGLEVKLDALAWRPSGGVCLIVNLSESQWGVVEGGALTLSDMGCESFDGVVKGCAVLPQGIRSPHYGRGGLTSGLTRRVLAKRSGLVGCCPAARRGICAFGYFGELGDDFLDHGCGWRIFAGSRYSIRASICLRRCAGCRVVPSKVARRSSSSCPGKIKVTDLVTRYFGHQYQFRLDAVIG